MSKEKESPKRNNIIRGLKSINLIPPLTAQEVVVVQSKIKLNVGAAISLSILFLITLLIVGFNVFAKLELNSSKDRLYKLENTLNLRENIIASNEEIVRRVDLYRKVEGKTYSTKDLINYFQNLSNGLAKINTYEITDASTFVISGTSSSLLDVAKLWYVLGNDKYIKSVNLENVVKDSTVARFGFKGELDLGQFKEDNNRGE